MIEQRQNELEVIIFNSNSFELAQLVNNNVIHHQYAVDELKRRIKKRQALGKRTNPIAIAAFLYLIIEHEPRNLTDPELFY